MKRLALSSLTLILAACGGSNGSNPTRPSEVLGTTWRLASLERPGQGAVSVASPDRYTFRLDPTGQASVRADCNACGGRYSLAEDTLTLSRLACTLVACPDDSLDGAFLAVLDGPARLRVEVSSLTLTSSEGTLRFTR